MIPDTVVALLAIYGGAQLGLEAAALVNGWRAARQRRRQDEQRQRDMQQAEAIWRQRWQAERAHRLAIWQASKAAEHAQMVAHFRRELARAAWPIRVEQPAYHPEWARP